MSIAMAPPRESVAGPVRRVAEPGTVRAAQRGDVEAREQLARACQRTAYLFALQLTGHRDDALDLAQEALLRVFRSLDRFDARRPMRPWLLRIVRNLVHDRARRRRVRRTEPLQFDVGALVIEPLDPSPSPEQHAARAELQRMLWQAVEQLPPKYREVVALRDYLDLTYAEISLTLKIPTGTVMSRLHRGRNLLRRLMRQRITEEARHD